MSVYIWLVVLLLLTAWLMKGNRKGNKLYIFTACALLFCVMAFRDISAVGMDSATSYVRAFNNAGTTDWENVTNLTRDEHNIGFYYFAKLAYQITGGDYQAFIMIISAICMISFARFIRKYSPSPVQSALYFMGLMFYTLMFDALKQALAMSILLFAFDAIVNRKPIRFIILVLFASWFHFPAMVFLPAYWIGNMKANKNYILMLGFMLLLTFIFREQLLKVMTDAYDTKIYDRERTFFATKVIIMIVIVAAALVLRKPTQKDRTYCIMLQLMGVAIVLQTFSTYNNTFERLSNYYFQVATVFIPLVFEDLSHINNCVDNRAFIKKIASYAFCAFAIWRFLDYVGNAPSFVNYSFYF